MLKSTRQQDITQLREENSRLRRSIDDLLNINQLAKIISSTMPVEQILDKVVTFSVKAISAQQGTISLLETKSSVDPFKTLVRKVDTSSMTNKFRLDDDLSGWMIKNRKPLLINDFVNDQTFKGHHARETDIHSILSVPLLCKGKLIGVLNLFNKKKGGEFSADDQRLLSIIGSQSAQVIENARLYDEERQLREIEKELETARSIQKGLLPKESPMISGFDVAGVSYAAKEVGGDYYDFIELPNQCWGLSLGDVSGKGIPAALLMANLQATLRTQAWTTSSIIECIAKTNEALYRNTTTDQFASLFFGVLNPEERSFTYINAGHNFPFLFTGAGDYRTLETGGLVLGFVADGMFQQESVELEPGDLLLIYSDGITEAEDRDEEMYGEKRLQQKVLANRHLTADQIITCLYEDVKDFTGSGRRQDDDITLVVLKAT